MILCYLDKILKIKRVFFVSLLCCLVVLGISGGGQPAEAEKTFADLQIAQISSESSVGNTNQTINPVKLRPAKGPNQPSSESNSLSKPVIIKSKSNAKELTPSSSDVREVGVSVEKLNSVSVDSVGLLSPRTGGLPETIWEGVSRKKLEKLMSMLPVNSKSPALRKLTLRVLLSRAKVPGRDSVNNKLSSLLNSRIRLLISMGYIKEAAELMSQIPPEMFDDKMLRAEADALFMLNDNARVCSLVSSQVRKIDTSYWQKAFIFCQSLAGEAEKAALGASLLRETGESTPIFHGLLNQISGLQKYNVKSLVDPEPLYFAMARVAKAELPDDVVFSNNPAILRTIAISPNASPGVRLEAAEKAEALGVLKTELLRQLYAGVAFSETAEDTSTLDAGDKLSSRQRALFYRKALVESSPHETAKIISKALALAMETGHYSSSARVYLPVLKGLQPSEEISWFGKEAIRALLSAGEIDLVVKWFEFYGSMDSTNIDVKNILSYSRPLALISGAIDDGQWNPEMLKEWRSATSKISNTNASDNEEVDLPKVMRLYTLVYGLGYEIPDSYWDELVNNARVSTIGPYLAIWESIDRAVQNGSLGEAILLFLIAMGENGPGDTSNILLQKILFSMNKLGLNKEARVIALEAALATGL